MPDNNSNKSNIGTLFFHISVKVLVVLLIACGLAYNDSAFVLTRLMLFVVAGVVSGFYTGIFNDYIWRNDDQDKKTKIPNYPIPYLTHTLFNHMIGGVVGAFSLFFLINGKDFSSPQNITFGLKDLVLLLVALTGFFGLIPRTLWYGSYGPTLGGKS